MESRDGMMELIPVINMEYDWYSDHNYIRYILYPEKGVHKPEDIGTAKQWLKFNHKLNTLQIRWKNLGDTTAPPAKIPDQAIISELRKTIGEQESYIQELEHKINTGLGQEETQLKKQLRKDILSEELYKVQEAALKKLRKQVKDYQQSNSKLIAELYQLKNKI